MTQQNRETLLALAEKWERSAVVQSSNAVHDVDTQHRAVAIAAMFEVAAALRATASSIAEPCSPTPITGDQT